jgi:hypothetical protein|nr:hypothetical protein [uncultured Capnocytophaga sp.]
MKKIIIFTNEKGLRPLAPDTPLFWEGKGKILGLRGNILYDYTEEDSIFIVDDTIAPAAFQEFYKKQSPDNDVFILYHQKGGVFDEKSVFEGIEKNKIKKGSHVGNAEYQVFLHKVIDILVRENMLKDEWIRIEYPYTQPQVQEIISAIFKDEADDKLNEAISYLYAKFKQIYETEKSEKEKKDAFERLARERDALLNTLINNQK